MERVKPSPAPDAEIILPTIYPPLDKPVSGQKYLVCRGVLFEAEGMNWKIQLEPRDQIPGYFGVITPLGARFYETSKYVFV